MSKYDDTYEKASRKAPSQPPAPVSATEPYRCDRCGIADATVEWNGDFAQHMTDGGCFFALAGERTTLRARVAELERVTEEQVERACAKMWGAENWSGYNLFEKDAMRAKMRAALTAARGGG